MDYENTQVPLVFVLSTISWVPIALASSSYALITHQILGEPFTRWSLSGTDNGKHAVVGCFAAPGTSPENWRQGSTE